MIEFIRSWILGLTGAAAVCAVATLLTPRGPVKGVTRTVCGVVMAAALVSPLIGFDFPAYSLNLAQYRARGDALIGRAEEISGALSRRSIEAELEAYILDKAQTLGAAADAAKVTVAWSTEGYWYPVAAELGGSYDAALSALIEGELGIPREAQTWNG